MRHIARGLAEFQNKSFHFPNFARIPLFVSIIALECFTSEYAQSAYISFLFSLRVPAETWILRRACAGDPIADHTPQPDKALIELATLDGHTYLVMKFSIIKNIAYGCIRRRPCF